MDENEIQLGIRHYLAKKGIKKSLIELNPFSEYIHTHHRHKCKRFPPLSFSFKIPESTYISVKEKMENGKVKKSLFLHLFEGDDDSDLKLVALLVFKELQRNSGERIQRLIHDRKGITGWFRSEACEPFTYQTFLKYPSKFISGNFRGNILVNRASISDIFITMVIIADISIYDIVEEIEEFINKGQHSESPAKSVLKTEAIVRRCDRRHSM